MTVLRWILGIVAALLAVGGLLGLALGVAFDSRIWSARAKTFRNMLWLVALFWFNVEVWGRVVYTVVHWK
jgi:hypothetical protein